MGNEVLSEKQKTVNSFSLGVLGGLASGFFIWCYSYLLSKGNSPFLAGLIALFYFF
jgi:hypothetical protein